MPLKTYFNLHDKGVSLMFEMIIIAYNGIVEVIGFIVCFYNREEIFKIAKVLVQQNHCSARSEMIIITEMLSGLTLILLGNFLHWIYFGSKLCNAPVLVLHAITAFSEFSVHLQFIYFVFLLRLRFLKMNLTLKNLCLKAPSGNDIIHIPSADFVEILQSCRINHNSICGISESVNSIYARFVLFNIGLSFFRSVHNTYRIVSASVGLQNDIIYSHPLLYLSYHWMKLTSIAHTCSSSAKEVSSTYLCLYQTVPKLMVKNETVVVINIIVTLLFCYHR
jgi:hypothetical protein